MTVGRPCAALHNGQWVTGVIIKHDVKINLCTVKTTKYGNIRVNDHKIRLTDKPIWEQ